MINFLIRLELTVWPFIFTGSKTPGVYMLGEAPGAADVERNEAGLERGRAGLEAEVPALRRREQRIGDEHIRLALAPFIRRGAMRELKRRPVRAPESRSGD